MRPVGQLHLLQEPAVDRQRRHLPAARVRGELQGHPGLHVHVPAGAGTQHPAGGAQGVQVPADQERRFNLLQVFSELSLVFFVHKIFFT